MRSDALPRHQRTGFGRRFSPLIPSAVPSAVGFFLIAIAAAAVLMTYVSYARGYFFLFDDFALVGQASNAVGDIFGSPLFGFYRPAVFLVVKVERIWFGWHSPSGYIATSMVFHVINSGLTFALLHRIGTPNHAKWWAASIFLLSPWASEGYFWVSALFDVLSTFGVLTALLCGLAVLDAASWRRGLIPGAIGIAAAAIGLFSKETAVTLPLLCAAVFALTRCRRAVLRPAPVLYALLLMIVTGVYLYARHRVLPILSGAYGDLPTLFAHANTSGNALSYVRGLVAVPFPGRTPGAAVGSALVVAACVYAALLAWSAKSYWRLGVMAVFGFWLTIAPVLWLGAIAGSSAANRFLYLPGVWVAAFLGIALGDLEERARRSRLYLAGLITGLSVVLVPASISVVQQARSWSHACVLARTSINQFRAVLPKQLSTVYIPNLPFWFADGPYVLKPYAFGFYFDSLKVPEVRTRNMVLFGGGEVTVFQGWVDSTNAPPRADEYILTLHLPVVGDPGNRR